jgi:hypothetical protein
MESEALKGDGVVLDLSEEYLGFYRIAEHIMSIVQTKLTPEAILAEVSCQRFQGLHIMKSSDRQRRGGFELVEAYGIVPDEVYKVKFETEEQRTNTFLGIKKRIGELVAIKDPAKITMDDIAGFVITGAVDLAGKPIENQEIPSNFSHLPPREFSFAGRQWTPQSFYKDYVKVRLDHFEKLNFASESDFPKMINLIKKALASGYSVPFGFGVDRNHLFLDSGETVFSGGKRQTEMAGYSGPANPYDSPVDHLKGLECEPKDIREYQQGRHAVLITDFENVGGTGKELDPYELNDALAQSAFDLDYLVIKNSWGIDEQGQEGEEAGTSWLGSKTGYYRIDRDYLINSLKSGVVLNITIPKTVRD